MSRKQPVYTPEFPQQIVDLVRSGRSPTELAKEFGCHLSSIQLWVRKSGGSTSVMRSSALNVAEQEELIRLRKENKQLKIERDILSKATAWFANSNGPMSGETPVCGPGAQSAVGGRHDLCADLGRLHLSGGRH